MQKWQISGGNQLTDCCAKKTDLPHGGSKSRHLCYIIIIIIIIIKNVLI